MVTRYQIIDVPRVRDTSQYGRRVTARHHECCTPSLKRTRDGLATTPFGKPARSESLLLSVPLAPAPDYSAVPRAPPATDPETEEHAFAASRGRSSNLPPLFKSNS